MRTRIYINVSYWVEVVKLFGLPFETTFLVIAAPVLIALVLLFWALRW
jgi:hypothetical protein